MPSEYPQHQLHPELTRRSAIIRHGDQLRRLLRGEPPPKCTCAETPGFCKAHPKCRPFVSQRVLPEIERGVALLPLFEGLEREQVRRVAGACGIARFSDGETIIEEGGRDATLFILLSGEAMIRRAGARQPVGVVRTGECLGEMSLLTGEPHSASAVAAQATETAALSHADLASLIRARPDIGLIVFRNLAIGLGAKLGRAPRV